MQRPILRRSWDLAESTASDPRPACILEIAPVMVQVPRILSISAAGVLACLALARAQSPPVRKTRPPIGCGRVSLRTTASSPFSLSISTGGSMSGRGRFSSGTAGPKSVSWEASMPNRFFPALAAAMVAQGGLRFRSSIADRADTGIPFAPANRYLRDITKPRGPDVAQLREALRQNPGSVHMTLDQSPDGRILCYPMEDGPCRTRRHQAWCPCFSPWTTCPAEGKSISALRVPPLLDRLNTPDLGCEVRQPQGKIEEYYHHPHRQVGHRRFPSPRRPSRRDPPHPEF